MTNEPHLIIIWQNARNKQSEIIADISEKFLILRVLKLRWDEDNFSKNLTRFYGVNLPKGTNKEFEVGLGYFTLIIFSDESPKYETRKTSKGELVVNSNVFDAKELYRSWTGGGHKIHGTNSVEEMRHNLMLLLGESISGVFAQSPVGFDCKKDKAILDRNLIGTIQWESLNEMFLALNETCNYVVLRNFEGFPSVYRSELHGDIDILVDNFSHALCVLNAEPVFSQKYRNHFRVNVGGNTIRIDIRFVGDEYYCKSWQKRIIKNRMVYNGFYIPSEIDFKYSLLYHTIIHKNTISEEYQLKLNNLGFDMTNAFYSLHEFLTSNEYIYSQPQDLSVFFNWKILSLNKITYSLSINRRLYWAWQDLKSHIKKIISPSKLARVNHVLSKFR